MVAVYCTCKINKEGHLIEKKVLLLWPVRIKRTPKHKKKTLDGFLSKYKLGEALP